MRFKARFAAVALAAAALAAGAQAARDQAGGTPQMRNRAACTVASNKPSEADRALWQGKYDDAELLYSAALKADPASGKAMAGLVRTALRQDKIPEALALAVKFSRAYPNDPDVLDALGEVRFRRGEVIEASAVFDQSGHLGPCEAQIHDDAARFLNLYGMYASAQMRLNYAHLLAPDDPEISKRWQQSQQKPMTAEQQLAWLKDRLDHPPAPLKDDEKEAIEAAIKGLESDEKGSCELVTPVTEEKLPMVAAGDGAGLDVQINGKRKRLLIDTGASGLLLNRAVARAAGLVPEVETKAGGIGDDAPAQAYVTHVDSIRMGGMEFRNCMVRVVEQRGVLNTDGLIGPDVFRDFLVTLDFPGRQLRLGPLPRRPDQPAAQPVTLQAAGDEEPTESIAARAQDRTIAPAMKDWTPVFRAGQWLIIPTWIGNAPVKLFAFDSGAAITMISAAAAREVTRVAPDAQATVHGLSGEVHNVFAADNVSIAFAGVRQDTSRMASFDSAALSHAAGAELSGVIGFPTLSHLVVSIDYRDNLVHVVLPLKQEAPAH